MSAASERHIRRAKGQQLLDRLAADYAGRPGVDRAAMFGSTGLRVHAKFFAFVGTGGHLIPKLPRARAATLRTTGEASPVRIGRNTAREWINVTAPAAEEATVLWRALLSDAYLYVSSLTRASALKGSPAEREPR